MGPPASGPAPGRLRLRPWLEQQIHSGIYPGVSWLDQSGGVFQIPWKHAARHGWSIDRDASLFRSWAMYTGYYSQEEGFLWITQESLTDVFSPLSSDDILTPENNGRYLPGRDKPDPKTWKANFRCALNSLPDVKELREQSMKRGSLASRVYRLLPPRAPGRRRRGQQGCEAAAVRQIPEYQTRPRVPLDRFSEAFCRSRGVPCEEGVCYGLFQARDRESLPPYGRVKQEEGATAEQHPYPSFLHFLPQTSSCTPHTQDESHLDMWDSSTDEQEQTEAVYKIVDHLSTTDLWGQSGHHPGWRPASSLWEDCYCGDVDALACPLQAESYGPSGNLRSSLEDYTMGLSQ